MEHIQVLIADDHALIREGLGKVLSLEPRIQVVAVAANGQEAVEKSLEYQPKVVLMDLNMPQTNGVEAIKILRKELPGIRIIALTVHDDDEKVFEVIKSGVAGYVLKDIAPDVLINTILAVGAGETVIDPMVTVKLMGEINRLREVASTAEERENVLDLLTHRELEILKLIAKGNSNKDIADLLMISEKTVKNHISSIFRKIKVEDRTQAAVFAIKTKLVEV